MLKKKNQKGFTLIELLVVIAVIGILSAIGIVYIRGARVKAKIADAKTDIRAIYRSILMMSLDTGEWPGHQTINEVCVGCADNEINDLNITLAGLTADHPADPYNGWQGPYIDEVPLDPWGNKYFFDTDYDINPDTGQDWVAAIGSYGPNGGTPNEYDGDDVFLVVAPYVKYP